MKKKLILILLVCAILGTVSVLAASHLPVGLLKVEEHNKNLAQNILQNVSFFIAFLAGVTSLVSPCILPLFPAYFAITFKEKKKITLATSLFFSGFASIFIIMGLLATLTGRTLATLFEGVNSWIVPVAGAILIIFGIMILLGKGFTGIVTQKRFGDGWKGLIASGALFAVGWTACIGPIVSGVLLMISTFQNYFTGTLIMLFYSLGIFVPLFILSFFYDKLHLEKLPWLHKHISFRAGNRIFYTNYPNIISGILFIIFGLIFIIFRGTMIFNGLQMFGLRKYFYDWQNLFLEKTALFNKIGIAVFIIFIIFLLYFLKKELKEGNTDE